MWSAPESTGSPGFNTGPRAYSRQWPLAHTVADMQVSEKQLIKLLKGVFRVNQPIALLFDLSLGMRKTSFGTVDQIAKWQPVLTDEGKEVSFEALVPLNASQLCGWDTVTLPSLVW